MKTRNTLKPKLLMPLLLALSSAPALANEGAYGVFGGVIGGVIGPAIAQVAQFSSEERRAMRERWEQASPEERLQMRRDFKERARQIPSDPRRDADQWRNPPGTERDYPRAPQSQNSRQRGKYSDEASFGFGFERRRHEDDRADSPSPNDIPTPLEFFDRRDHRDHREKNRDGRRDDDRH